MKTEIRQKFYKYLILVMLIIPIVYIMKVHLNKIRLVENSDNYSDKGFSNNNLIEKQVEQLQEITENDPGVLAYIELGKKYEERHETDKAIATFKKAVELNGSSSYAHYYLCKLLNEKESFQEALEHCNKTLALLPGFELAEYQKEICINRLGGIENWK